MCAAALENYQIPQGRGGREIVALAAGGALTLIDESYNASPVSVRAALQTLGQAPIGSIGRRIAVLGDMKELGSGAAELHVGLAQAVLDAKINKVHCCGAMMAHLYEALPPSLRGCLAADSAELAPFVAKDVRDGDVVMVKGSHSMQMERVVAAVRAADVERVARKLAG